jgi:hypothetical protein
VRRTQRDGQETIAFCETPPIPSSSAHPEREVDANVAEDAVLSRLPKFNGLCCLTNFLLTFEQAESSERGE